MGYHIADPYHPVLIVYLISLTVLLLGKHGNLCCLRMPHDSTDEWIVIGVISMVAFMNKAGPNVYVLNNLFLIIEKGVDK